MVFRNMGGREKIFGENSTFLVIHSTNCFLIMMKSIELGCGNKPGILKDRKDV